MDEENITLNDLNSVLLEGTLTQDPVLSHDAKGGPYCHLDLASKRYFQRENSIEHETATIHVYTKGRMAERCMDTCHKGRKIRVVGCLRIVRNKNSEGRDVARLAIEAEHVEIKPEFTVKQDKKQSYDSLSR